MEKTKYNAHGQAKYHIDGRFTLVMGVLVLHVIACVLHFRQRELCMIITNVICIIKHIVI